MGYRDLFREVLIFGGHPSRCSHRYANSRLSVNSWASIGRPVCLQTRTHRPASLRRWLFALPEVRD